MKKLTLVLGLTLALPVSAMADSVGGCGIGSKVFEGRRGIASQALAVITNGSFGNNTFGISSGTLGCEQNGVVHSNWKTAMYLDGNMSRFAKDVSVGEGETLEALASLLAVENNDKTAFNKTLQNNFSTIFSSADSTSEEVLAALKTVLEEDAGLKRYAANI